jgi:hypothetical protein
VDVGDYDTTFTTYAETGVWQTRDYRWDGHRFVQVGGPTSFHAPATVHLSVTASPMHFQKPAGGSRAGSIAVTITNAGASPVTSVSVRLVIEDSWVHVGTGCTIGDDIAESCGDVTIAAGGQATVTLPVRIADNLVADYRAYGPVDGQSVVQVRVGGLRSTQISGLGATVFA